ncbi:DUF2332 domain-containing protein [Iamia sp.]|uniref:DUF2332 domain-containing protein n=1 Tax=Iamia sp. TaxID=2722710 RepID=UPI002C5A7E34|nr:DUF2332 domain-containing protein [Iamia sp.]HXH55703.1 DUF2332 domain-containing protein [Iamia sp.]
MSRSERASASGHDAVAATVADLQAMFAAFAATYPELRLYRAICEGAAADDAAASLLAVARPGQARPVLFLAALHDLVLRRTDLGLARWYPSVTGGGVPDGDPWPEVRTACFEHADELRDVIATRATQTNEVNRVVHLAPLVAHACADVADAPVALVEMGCSAGLLLGLDRYRIEVSPPEGLRPVVLGDPGSEVVCAGRQRDGPSVSELALPAIVERVGLDLHPVGLDDAREVRWLEACLWPDVPGRLERFRAAVRALRPDPPEVVAGDMVADLGPVAHSARAVAGARLAAEGSGAAVHLVVFSSWALTYARRDRRGDVAATLADLAADGRPVSWLTAEPPGCVPDLAAPEGMAGIHTETGAGTVLGAHRWRDGRELPPAVWGTSHPHGAWFRRAPTP